MPSLHANPTDLPTPEDNAYWLEEAAAYEYQPPNPRAQEGTPEKLGWGIPPDRFAPSDAVDYVLCKYREEELDIYVHDPRAEYNYAALHPMFKWSLVSAVWAHFLWFRTRAGGQWVNNFFGIQEVQPFYEGYSYQWAHPQTGEVNELFPPQYQSDGSLATGSIRLRIFRQWERNVEPPITKENLENLESMKKLLSTYRNPYAKQPDPWKDGVFTWVSKQLQLWFLEPKPDDRWPVPKRGRITGADWVRALELTKGVPIFGGLSKIAKYHQSVYREKGSGVVRAYRIEDSRGGVHWCPGSEMRIIPRLDYHRKFKQDKTEPELQAEFGCVGCRATRSCVPYTGREKMCCSCYAKQLEQGSDMPMLNQCTMLPECRGCPDSIDTHTKLVNLKQQWNRQPRNGPIPR